MRKFFMLALGSFLFTLYVIKAPVEGAFQKETPTWPKHWHHPQVMNHKEVIYNTWESSYQVKEEVNKTLNHFKQLNLNPLSTFHDNKGLLYIKIQKKAFILSVQESPDGSLITCFNNPLNKESLYER